MMPRLSYAAGYMGDASAFWPLLPAAQTFTAPAASTCDIASFRVWLKPPPPQELFVTRMLKPCCISDRTLLKPSAASEMSPLPLESRNLTDSSCTFQLMPAMPVPLLANAPIVPATCVPCPKSSFPPAEHVPLIHVNPCVVLLPGSVQRLLCRSGCVKSIPVSMIATITSPALVWVSHAAGAAIFAMSYCWFHSGSVGVVTAWT